MTPKEGVQKQVTLRHLILKIFDLKYLSVKHLSVKHLTLKYLTVKHSTLDLMTALSTESRSALSGSSVVVEGPEVVLENLQVLFVLWVGISPPPPSSLWNTFLPAS